MFNGDFYPTPFNVAADMVAMLNKPLREYKFILEPSAGKGDLIDHIETINGRYVKPKIYACETEPDLQMILAPKAILLNDDFLAFDGDGYHFDLVMMNPPFSQGAKHLLHAWEIVTDAEIICVLNAETIRNPYTEERKLLQKLIADFGHVRYFTDAFKNAERKTGVEIALVHLVKVSKKVEAGSFNDLQANAEKFDLAQALSDGTALQNPDFIRDMVGWKKEMVGAFAELLTAYEKIKYYAAPLMQDTSKFPAIIQKCIENKYSARDQKQREEIMMEFNETVTDMAWGSVFTKAAFRKVLTQRMQENFDKHRAQQGQRAFTEENIRSMLMMLIENQGSILEQCIMDTFDAMTGYAKDNRVYKEGWKTNDKYEVSKKVILPGYVVYEPGFKSFRTSFYIHRYPVSLSDIDKALAVLTGKKIDDTLDENKQRKGILTIEEAMRKAFQDKAMECESEFFNIRFFKKGTLHLVFKDPAIHRKLNEFVWKKKGWIQDGNWGKK